MLLERTAAARPPCINAAAKKEDAEQPLTCMFYFFASQMNRNIQTRPPQDQSPQVHPLNKLLSKVGTHAAFSPLVTQFETFPVEIPELHMPGRKPLLPKEIMHDTMLLMKFRSKRAREEWIATREWIEFMEKTESEGVFRRMPHVRCAKSLRGLSDPMEVLGI